MRCNRHVIRFSFLSLLLQLFMLPSLRAQDSIDTTAVSSPPSAPKVSKWAISGYLKDLQYIQFKNVHEQWTLDNLIHNRIDLRWYPGKDWKVHVGLRNRLLYGQSVALYQQNESLLDGNNGYFDLGRIWADGKSYLLHATLDRASVDYSHGKWQVTVGRQRINWGMNLVWNPNDIFNAYSYFDFDYEERPGTDALRVQYYLNSTSSAELAYKPGKTANSSIIAALYKFNYKSYDIQFLAGKVNNDYAIGGGWSGVLGKAGFNGELTAFIPNSKSPSSNTLVSASAGVNYTFDKSLYLHSAYLLNSGGVSNASAAQANLLLENVSAKSLSPSKHSLLGEVAYQFTPLIRGDISSIVDLGDGSFFLGPFATFSLTDNIEFLTGGQLFFGGKETLYGDYGKVIYLRLKWSF